MRIMSDLYYKSEWCEVPVPDFAKWVRFEEPKGEGDSIGMTYGEAIKREYKPSETEFCYLLAKALANPRKSEGEWYDFHDVDEILREHLTREERGKAEISRLISSVHSGTCFLLESVFNLIDMG